MGRWTDRINIHYNSKHRGSSKRRPNNAPSTAVIGVNATAASAAEETSTAAAAVTSDEAQLSTSSSCHVSFADAIAQSSN